MLCIHLGSKSCIKSLTAMIWVPRGLRPWTANTSIIHLHVNDVCFIHLSLWWISYVVNKMILSHWQPWSGSFLGLDPGRPILRRCICMLKIRRWTNEDNLKKEDQWLQLLRWETWKNLENFFCHHQLPLVVTFFDIKFFLNKEDSLP